jgi:hypothetical protein
VLGILAGVRAGSAAEHEDLAEDLSRARARADQLLIAAVLRGTRPEQALAVALAGACTVEARSLLLGWACGTRSAWLEDLAISQASLLPELPKTVEEAVLRMLLSRELSGALRAEPTRTEAQLRRIDRTGYLLRAAQRLRWVRAGDAFAVVAVVGFLTDKWSGRLSSEPLARVLMLAVWFLSMAMLGPMFRLILWSSSFRRSSRIMTAAENELYGMWVFAVIGILVRIGWIGGVGNLGTAVKWLLVLPAAVTLGFRPGAYYATRLGYFGGPVWWLAGLLPTWSFIRVFLNRRWFWKVLLAVAAAIGLEAGISTAPDSVDTVATAGIALVFCLFAVFIIRIGAVWARDLLLIRRMRRRAGSIDADQVLRDAASFKMPALRTNFLRWVREQGRLHPTSGGKQTLRDAILAIERDAHARRQKRQWFGGKNATPDPDWGREFTAFYIESGVQRSGLAAWEAGTLDEIGQLAAQIESRIDDADATVAQVRQRS